MFSKFIITFLCFCYDSIIHDLWKNKYYVIIIIKYKKSQVNNDCILLQHQHRGSIYPLSPYPCSTSTNSLKKSRTTSRWWTGRSRRLIWSWLDCFWQNCFLYWRVRIEDGMLLQSSSLRSISSREFKRSWNSQERFHTFFITNSCICVVFEDWRSIVKRESFVHIYIC